MATKRVIEVGPEGSSINWLAIPGEIGSCVMQEVFRDRAPKPETVPVAVIAAQAAVEQMSYAQEAQPQIAA